MSLNLEKFKEKKIVITGCAGFIASHLTEWLLKAGAEVIGIDNLYNGVMSNLENIINYPKFTFF